MALLLGACGALLIGASVWCQFAENGPDSYFPLVLALAGGASLAAALRNRQTDIEARSETTQEPSSNEAMDSNSHKRLLEALLDSSRQGILLLGSDLRVASANERAVRMFDGRRVAGMAPLELTLSTDLATAVAQSVKDGMLREVHVTIAHPADRLLNLTVVPTALPTNPVMLLADDQTELTQLRTIRSDFVANVSHELRTPLATIRSMAETILDDDDLPAEDEARFLRRIISEIDRLTAISEDLLTLSGAESKPLVKAPVDLSQLVESTCLGMEVQARERNLQLLTNVQPGIIVEADANQLTQVLLNLVGNSLRFTESGSISVSLKSEQGRALLQVADTGIGIPAEHLPRVFERFYRADPARSRGTGGTGLGLSIVKHIVVAHGGTVEIESEPDHGTTVTVRLPLAD